MSREQKRSGACTPWRLRRESGLSGDSLACWERYYDKAIAAIQGKGAEPDVLFLLR